MSLQKLGLVSIIAGSLALLVGCGGGGSSTLTSGGGGGGSGSPAKSLGKTRLDIDLTKGTVAVVPLTDGGTASSKAVFSGSSLNVTSATVGSIQGNGVQQQLLSLNIAINSSYYNPAGGPIRVSFQPTTGSGLRSQALAGSGTGGIVDSQAAYCAIGHPNDTFVDADGSVYITQSDSGGIRKLSAGTVTTVNYGYGKPMGIVGDGTFIYFADQANNRIIKLYKNGLVGYILAGNGSAGFTNGAGISASFNQPTGLALIGTTLYVADYGNNAIRTVDTGTGATSTFQTGVPGAYGVAAGTLSGQQVVVATGNTDGNFRIFGTAGGSTFLADYPGVTGVAVLPNNTIVVCNGADDQFRIVQLPAGANPFTQASYYTVAVAGGAGNQDGSSPTFNNPQLLGYSTGTGLIEADNGNNRIRTVSIDSSAASGSNPVTFLNPQGFMPGPGSSTVPFYVTAPGTLNIGFSSPSSQRFSLLMVVDGPTVVPVISDQSSGVNTNLISLPIAGGSTTASQFVDGVGSQVRFQGAKQVSSSRSGLTAINDTNDIVLMDSSGRAKRITNLSGATESDGYGYLFNAGGAVTSLQISDDGNTILFTTTSAVFRLFKSTGGDPFDPNSWYGMLMAGTPGTTGYADGAAATATFNNPFVCFAPSSNGQRAFVADKSNNVIREIQMTGIDPTFVNSYTTATISGTSSAAFANGNAGASRYSAPTDIAYGLDGTLYVNDTGNFRIRNVTTSGTSTTVAGTGTAGQTDGAGGTVGTIFTLGLDPSGNVLFGDTFGGTSKMRMVSGGVLSSLTTISDSTVTGLSSDRTNGDVYWVNGAEIGKFLRIIS